MNHLSVRPTLAPWALTAWLMFLAPGAALANELRADGAASNGLVIHDAVETRERYCTSDAEGRLWLELPGGARFELVTSTADPRISNPGDGSFHPFEVAEVEAALGEVSFPIRSVRADVFVLPFPRRNGLESAAGPQLILLSPGVRPLSREQQHAEFVHELGHVVQYALLPDSDATRWSAYRRMRGIADESRYSAAGVHADRPHEIFAEDFRALFGGAPATYSGSIENPTIDPPTSISGLRDFLLELSDRPVVELERLVARPNPARGPIRFSMTRGETVPFDLYDVAGRVVATLEPISAGNGVQWIWNGADRRGGRALPGVLFGRPRGSRTAAVRVTIVE